MKNCQDFYAVIWFDEIFLCFQAFLEIYRNMADMPDPLPILEQSIERNQQLASKIQDFEIETKQLR